MSSRHVTGEERFRLYRLCECSLCEATGKLNLTEQTVRCPECRGEGRTRDLVATCATPEAVGVALVTLAREGEFIECPVGILDKPHADKPGTWLVKPWLPSARNISDAGRTLAKARKT